jgi:uncharacterized Fe-S cluster-containing radical SAM superfamily protein
MLDPKKRAEILRPKMMRNRKYLIAKIEGSGEEFKEKEGNITFQKYFKFKWYLKPDASTLSIKDLWSPNMIGLRRDFMSVPLKEVKKIRFQNPPYAAAYRFEGKGEDPRNYSKSLTIQVAGCNYDCNYCYVPKELRTASTRHGKYFTAKEIVETFLQARRDSLEPLNVIRITGGESILVPEIIRDVYEEVEKMKLERIYFWIDTNLSTCKYLEDVESDLKPVLRKKNVGIIGSFKGVTERDFSIITESEPKFYENQFETAKLLIDWRTDFYAYLPALVYEDDVENKLNSFIHKLMEVSKNLPLRVETDMIIEYAAAILNMHEKTKQGRPLPKTDQKLVFDLWYNKLLPRYYSKKMLNKFCCEIPL